MKWFSEDGERATWFEVLVVYPLGFLSFFGIVAYLIIMPG